MLQLDLACPIPWQRHEEPTPTKECKSKQVGFGFPQFTEQSSSGRRNTDASENGEAIASHEESEQIHLCAWLSCRYAEALWLGEQHSPLVGFLRHAWQMEKKANKRTDCVVALKNLMRSRQRIRQRLSGSLASGGVASRRGLCTLLVGTEDARETAEVAAPVFVEKMELQALRAALKFGPGQAVAMELRDQAGEGLGRFGQVWIDAIETRELQLQILVLLCLLRLYAKYPQLVDQEYVHAKSSRTSTCPGAQSGSNRDSSPSRSRTQEESPTQQRKRKRKVEKAHRLTGGMNIFPWQLGRKASLAHASTKQESDKSAEEVLLGDPQELSKQFELFIDALCLRVSTTNVTVDLEVDESSAPPISSVHEDGTSQLSAPPRTPKLTTAARHRSTKGRGIVKPPFGSEGRRRESEHDERDVLQWFCCQIVEANFSKSLPRQCGTLRSRCYVPSSVTPAKTVVRNGKRHRTHGEKALVAAAQTLDVRNVQRASSVEARPRLSSTPEPNGPLQQSLRNEDRQNMRVIQTLAAAKRRTTWNSREVHVRRKWERSASMGPSTNVEGATNAVQLRLAEGEGSTKPNSDARVPVPRHDPLPASQSRAHTLVFDTPAKSRLINVLPTRKVGQEQGVRPSGSFVSSLHTRIDPSTRSNPSPWRRTESQPVPILGRSLTNDLVSQLDTDTKERNEAIHAGQLSDVENEDEYLGTETLDESLRHIFNTDDEDMNGEGSNALEKTYMDWLGPSVSEHNVSSHRSNDAVKQTDENDKSPVRRSAMMNTFTDEQNARQDQDEEERLILSHRIRSSGRPSLWPSSALKSFALEDSTITTRRQTDVEEGGIQTIAPRRTSSPALLRPISFNGRIPTGRNPFAKSE